MTLATYVFFIFTVIGRQKIDTLKKGEYMRSGRMPMDIDLYIPVYTILQFFFYMGLLKVAEQLINPFGDDDEDFELNWLVDRHMKVSTAIASLIGLSLSLLSTPFGRSSRVLQSAPECSRVLQSAPEY